MTRKKKLALNTITSLTNQIITLCCGFILPRFFLTYYGSSVNGLVSSITQFLGFISLCECGIGAVIQSTLYEPLAKKDEEEISKVVISSEHFFRKIAYILVVYTVVLMAVYPLITLKKFDYVYTMTLIFVIAINSFAQYFFSMTYRLLLNADQLGFIQLGLQCMALVVNTIACVVLMTHGASIQLVKLSTSIIYMIQPLIITVYSRKHYKLNRNLHLTEEPIKQKWNGLAQHIAAVVLNNTDIAVLTIFSTMENVSVYTIYNLVVTGIRQIIIALTDGITATFGNMLARKEIRSLKIAFSSFEWGMHAAVTLLFSVTGILLVPFVTVYTKGVTDANYYVPIFAVLISMAQGAYCLRLPYNIIVLAAGHYKQTQTSAIIEASVNIVISIIMVFKFGLIGVAIGTLSAMIYRTCYLAKYLSHNIIHQKFIYFLKHVVVDIVGIVLIVVTTSWIEMKNVTYISWIFLAIKVFGIALFDTIVINYMFYKEETKELVNKLMRR